MNFGKRLEELLNKKGMTHDDLANKIGVTRAAVSNWCRGERFPKKEEFIHLIAEALDVPEQDLFDPQKREKIALEEFLNHPQKYRQHIKDRFDELPQEIKEIVENLLYLGQKEIELYHAEIKAKALRKKEIERDVKING
ncbi:MAG: helix-turn-helix transcriptional regulator [Epsilonproteobacteria bacterium]|nr:helix-turn-helix transcriptional regulator [Campylobacterota bacterium]